MYSDQQPKKKKKKKKGAAHLHMHAQLTHPSQTPTASHAHTTRTLPGKCCNRALHCRPVATEHSSYSLLHRRKRCCLKLLSLVGFMCSRRSSTCLRRMLLTRWIGLIFPMSSLYQLHPPHYNRGTSYGGQQAIKQDTHTRNTATYCCTSIHTPDRHEQRQRNTNKKLK